MKMRKETICIILSTIILLLLCSCQWDVWGSEVIDYGKGNGTINTSYIFTGESPKYVTATKSNYADKIIVSWNGVTGADYYEIYRTTNPEANEWKKLTANAVKKAYIVDEDVVAGVNYYYKVRARSFSNLSLLGEMSEVTYGNILTSPLSFSASQGESNKEIKLEWTTVENVNGYRIYWSTLGYDGTWNTFIPKGVQSTDYVFSKNTTQASFIPDKQYNGVSIYFYIVSLSSSKKESKESIIRIGYTYIEGAPSAPKNFKASRGEEKDSITLSWDEMYPNNDPAKSYDWNVYRFTEGKSEVLIYSTENGDNQPTIEDGKMSIVDDMNLEEGIEYTYKIIAIGDVETDDGNIIRANGFPSTANGFILSPPMEIVSKSIKNNGFEFVFKDTLGAQEHSEKWKYVLLGRKTDKDDWKPISNYSSISINESGEYVIQTVFDNNSENEEESYEYFSLCTDTGSLQSRRYDEIVSANGFYLPRPSVVEDFNASDNYVFENSPNGDGLYPISITFAKNNSVVSYDLKIWQEDPDRNKDAKFTLLEGLKADELDKNRSIIKGLNSYSPLGTKYYFSIIAYDSLGRSGAWSDVDSGYSAITGSKLIEHMQVYAFKPWEFIDTPYLTSLYPYLDKDINAKWKNSAIYNKIKQAGTGSLSSGIEEKSYFFNGTIRYSAEVKGLGGRVSFIYKNFGETEYLNTTGSYTMEVSMSGDGSASGALSLSGMYRAEISLQNISVKSQKFVGTYTVKQANGLESEEVSPSVGSN